MKNFGNSDDIIKRSSIKFGTSGARGLVEDFTFEVCAAFASSYFEKMIKSYSFKKVFIGIDNRPSSPQMAAYCIASAEALDLEVEYCGVLPTPALALYAMSQKAPAIMITGSHIPFDRNGIKFYSPEGEITKEDEQAIVNDRVSVLAFENSKLSGVNPAATNFYIERHKKLFSNDVLKNMKIGVFEHSSAGRDIYAPLFKELGAEVISLSRSDTFVPIDTEAVDEYDVQKALAWSKEYQFDAIFSTDGDGDRPLIADENGSWLRGDIVGLLGCIELNIKSIATPVSCNTSIELSNIFDEVARTKIGSPYVIAEFERLNAVHESVAGFEANGGFLLGSDTEYNGVKLASLATRDALLPFLLILSASIKKEVPISHLLQQLPFRYTTSDRLKNIDISFSQDLLNRGTNNPEEFLAQLGLNYTLSTMCIVDGLRLTLSNSDIVHLRPSGNAPELRIYIQSDTKPNADNLLRLVIERLKVLINDK